MLTLKESRKAWNYLNKTVGPSKPRQGPADPDVYAEMIHSGHKVVCHLPKGFGNFDEEKYYGGAML